VHEDLCKLYPQLMPHVKISVVQSGDHVLNTFDSNISEFTEKHFLRHGIELLTNTRVVEVQDETVTITQSHPHSESPAEKKAIPYGVCVWSTGIAPNPLVSKIIAALPESQTNSKVLVTDDHLKLKGVHGVYSLGDCSTVDQQKLLCHFVELFKEADENGDGVLQYAEFERFLQRTTSTFPHLASYGKKAKEMFGEADTNQDGVLNLEEFKLLLHKVDSALKNLPATAQVASQQGKYLAKVFNADAEAKASLHHKPFAYRHLGSFSYVGSNASVAELGQWKLSGLATWFLWRSAYWGQQTSVRNKVCILLDWTITGLFGRDTSRF